MPDAITVAEASSPSALIGAPPSMRIAVKGSLLPLLAIMPEAASVAVAVRASGRLDQPLGMPASRIAGSVLST
jgi:hypothetical protein